MLPRDASADGHRIDALLHDAAAVVVIAFTLVLVSLVVLVVRYRARPGVRALYDHGNHFGHRAATAALVLAVFVGVDMNLVGRSHADLIHRLWAFPHGPDVVRVEILARQWSWQARYAGPDGAFGTPDDVVTLDDVRVPVGRSVSVQLRAADVVHGFFLPSFRVKQDAIPGRVTRTWFRPRIAGTYEIACAQFCGQGHYRMRGVLRVLSPADWDRWLRDASADGVRAHVDGSAADRTAWPWHD